MTALSERSLDELTQEAIAFHGHLCPGLVLGIRMARAGCREVGVDRPRSAGKALVVFVEIDRCATDSIQALTGVSLGRRTLKHLDYGKKVNLVAMATRHRTGLRRLLERSVAGRVKRETRVPVLLVRHGDGLAV